METTGGPSEDFPVDLAKGVSSHPLSAESKGDIGITETDLLGYDPAAPSHGLSETASKETNRFLDELMSDAMNIVPNLAPNKDENESKSVDSKKLIDDFDFGFEKPLPPEPLGATSDFLKSETGLLNDDLMKPAPVAPKDDFLSAPEPPQDKSRTPSPAPREETPSPVPPPVPKHQQLRDESPEPYEPTQTPEPDSEFKPVEEAPPREPTPPPTRPREPTPPPVRPREPTPPPREPTPPPREPTPTPPQKPVEPPPPTPKPTKKLSTEDIGAKDIRSKLNAWFNPARLHPTVESLLYWRDPKKSGVVFGATMLSLLSLTAFSLISVVAYLSLFTLGGTICFRIYKSIMQAVQKTSDGHPFKDLLELDLSIPEEKVNEISKDVVAYVNSSLATLRSLILVEDLIDSIKFLVLSWVLTYIGACFNGLTLIIIGVVLLFTLPTVYEKNKAQIDVYVKIAMDKLSIITNKMRAAVPEGKKEEKKDQ